MCERILILLSFLGLLLPLTGQEILLNKEYNAKTGTSLRMTAMSNMLPSSGYLSIRVNVRNGEKIRHIWNFNFTSQDQHWGDYNSLASSFTLTCDPGKQRNVEFLIPLVTAINDDSSLLLETQVMSNFRGIKEQHEMTTEHVHSLPDVLMSEALDTVNSGTLDTTNSSSRRHGGFVDFAGNFSPTALSPDWRAYSGFDLMMLTSADWKQIAPGAKTAILKWNRLGGRILIYGTDPSVTLHSLGFQDANNKTTLIRSSGQIELHELPPRSILDPKETIRLAAAGEFKPQAELYAKELAHDWPLQNLFGERSFNPIFLILILIAFGIIVGPINLFVFAKANQRHRLFITTPIISLTASAILIAIIILQDGFGGKGLRSALIEIQPEENAAYIHQEQIARTGVLLKTSFETNGDTLVHAAALGKSRWTRVTPENNGAESRYRLAFKDQNVVRWDGDWYKSRSEYGHILTAVKATRGRLERLPSSGDAPVVTSTFPYPLKTIYYQDQDGNYWKSAHALASGEQIQLTSIPESSYLEWLRKQKENFHSYNQTRLELLTDRDDHFTALAGKEALIETLSSLKWQKSSALLTGTVARP